MNQVLIVRDTNLQINKLYIVSIWEKVYSKHLIQLHLNFIMYILLKFPS